MFTNVNLDLDGRRNYSANGDYTYVDDFGTKQNIFFKEIYSNKEGVTEANASIDENKPFNLGSQFKFKGTVNLMSSNKNLSFDGYFKVNNICNLINSDWVRFDSEIDPEMVKFKLNNTLMSDNDERLATGVFMNLDSTHMYTSFLSEKERSIDVGIIKSDSYLTYESPNFIVMGDDSLSNIFAIDQNTCSSSSEGVIDLNLDFGQLEIKSIGFVDRDEEEDKTDLQSFLLLDFMFSEEALQIMADNIYEAYSSTEFNYGNRYKKNLARLVGGRQVDELIIDLDLDVYNFENKITIHEKQGADINVNIIEDSESEMYGVLCYLEGNKIATSSQFFITDSTSYFVSGGLEFNTSINSEIEVQNNIMKQEVLKFIDSFTWSSISR